MNGTMPWPIEFIAIVSAAIVALVVAVAGGVWGAAKLVHNAAEKSVHDSKERLEYGNTGRAEISRLWNENRELRAIISSQDRALTGCTCKDDSD